MKAAFHYIVRIKLIRPANGKNIEFIESEKVFKNKLPITAREEAFRYYQSYIDVLLQGEGKEYLSDKEARRELKSFVESGKTRMIEIGETEFEISDSYGNGIGIFMVIDSPIADDIFQDKIEDEYLIHGIGNLGWSDDEQSLMDSLNHEFWYYQHYEYDIKEFQQIVDFYEYDAGETDSNKILITPFDWTDYDKPISDLNDGHRQESKEINSVEQIIADGESNQVEFKPSLLYNFSTQKAGISIKGIIAKAICAFLNSNGGFLLIGVNDNGNVQGLEYDFQLSDDKSDKDFFQLEFDQMLEQFLSFSVKSNVVGQFYEIEGKEIYVVTVSPNKRRPIFLKGQNGKEFYVRGEASSRQLTDIEEIVNYCIDRWTE